MLEILLVALLSAVIGGLLVYFLDRTALIDREYVAGYHPPTGTSVNAPSLEILKQRIIQENKRLAPPIADNPTVALRDPETGMTLLCTEEQARAKVDEWKLTEEAAERAYVDAYCDGLLPPEFVE